MTNCSLCYPPATPLLLLLQPLLLFPSTKPFFLHLTTVPNLEMPHNSKTQIHNIGTSLAPWLIWFNLIYCHYLPPPCSLPTHIIIFLFIRPCCSNPLLLLFLLSSLHSLRPSCLSFLHGTVAFLWTSLPVACGHVPTPLHCPPLRSVSFPLSLFPLPLWPPAPLLPPAVSKERYATLPLYSFRYVIILSSPFFYYYCYLARWACLVSCCWLLFIFNHWWLVIRVQDYGSWGCLFWSLYDLFLVVVGLCEESMVRTPHKAAAFHSIFKSCDMCPWAKKINLQFIIKEHRLSVKMLPY